MTVERTQIGWGFWTRWLLATTVGWPVGVIGGFILAHIANIAYPRETNLMLGIGLGAGVGYMQWRVLRQRLSPAGWWVLASAAGVGVPFVVAVVVDELGGPPARIVGWTVTMASGGTLAGLLQLRVLRPHTLRSGWWVLASTVGWALSGFAFEAGFLGAFLIGGIALGAVTGGALIRLLRPPTPDDVSSR